jgi:hypothetical protein
MRIAPLQNEPDLIAYECPACDKMTSELWPAGTRLRLTGFGSGIDIEHEWRQ